MDHKAWLWRKKSAEKTVANDNVDLPGKENEEQQEVPIQTTSTDRAELEKELKQLTDKLSSALSECNTKDSLVKKHEKMAREAIAGWDEAESEVVSLRKRLDESLKQRLAAEERLGHLDAALKECMQQLRFVREEQEQRIHDAVMRTSKEFEKTQAVLQEKLEDTNRRLTKMGTENTRLSKSLLLKEKLVEDLNKQKKQAEVDMSALMARLDSMEKDNASLKYEVRVLEKELEIRNEEREFNRRTADLSHKQHLESVKKIAKLESECQRLRLLVQKRLPGPAALAKMKNEVEMLGRDSVGRRKINSGRTGSMVDFDFEAGNYPATTTKRINILTEQFIAMEEENKALKDALSKKGNELQFSRIMHARTASKLSQVEGSPRGQKGMELTRSTFLPHEPSMASISDNGSDDKVSNAGSWASALISELENFRNEKQKGLVSSKIAGASDMTLMDDFVEMEKLAIVAVDEPSRYCDFSSKQDGTLVGPSETNSDSGFCQEYKVSCSSCTVSGKVRDWLQQIVEVIMEQYNLTQRHPDEILEDIRVTMAHIHQPNPEKSGDTKESSNANVGIPCKPSHNFLGLGFSHDITELDISSRGKRNQKVKLDVSKSMSKLIELIESINISSQNYEPQDVSMSKDGHLSASKNSERPMGYMVRVFQWKACELGDVLQQFLHTCYDLLSEKTDLCKFFQELASALEWVLNHCFSLQDVSSMRDEIMKRFEWDESRSENEAEAGITCRLSDAHRLHISIERGSSTLANGTKNMAQLEEVQSNLTEQNRKLEEDLVEVKAAKVGLEGQLQSAIGENESLMNQLKESLQMIESLHIEMNNLKESKDMADPRNKDHRSTYEDLDRQLAVVKVELNEAHQKYASLEVELENRNSFCEELEATCLDLQLQLESMKKNENLKSDRGQEEKQLQANWEIKTASKKLAECQETILNLGKQLKALASPTEAVLFDKIVPNPADAISSTTTNSTMKNDVVSPKNNNKNHRSSLLDQMLAEDNVQADSLKSSNVNEGDDSYLQNGMMEPQEKSLDSKTVQSDETGGSLAIVPLKKQGGGSLWRKLLWRKKRVNSQKPSLLFSP